MGDTAALAFGLWLGKVIPGFLLILARCVGLTLQAPIFGARAVPAMIRIGLAMSLALLYWMGLTTAPMAPDNFLLFFIAVASELLFGVTLGYAGSIIHYAVQGAGDFVAQACGLTMISTMNPMIRTNTTPTGTVLYYLALVVFCMMGGHLVFLGGFFQTFDLVPLGGFHFTPALWGMIMEITGALLGIVLQLAMPAVLVMLLVDVTLGVINRTTPQAQNLLDFVQAIKPGLGLTIFALMIPNVVVGIHHYSEVMIQDVQKVIVTQTQLPPPGP